MELNSSGYLNRTSKWNTLVNCENFNVGCNQAGVSVLAISVMSDLFKLEHPKEIDIRAPKISLIPGRFSVEITKEQIDVKMPTMKVHGLLVNYKDEEFATKAYVDSLLQRIAALEAKVK
ncbi:hypothetical protein TRFO_41877 [Tritrichomonas foetus]|uniref:Uncharacterized protein n=1 Tax=Tritrichomonas foetus TaxID=1144522 RepID=A0A1J4L301_9EUKA|nr:hypothetical protein TRFO_41877 [Tritrichomonas foetus]|eukprot:OHT16326.1 hypothetical protein TRFO_41877 [Tritrichomonas foetus]